MGADSGVLGAGGARGRGGRPPDGERARDAEIHVRVDARGRQAIDDRRKVTGETRAAWVRRAIAFAHVHMLDEWQRRGDPIANLDRAHQCSTGRGAEYRTERFTDAP